MEDKVGSHNPSQKDIDKWTAQVHALGAQLEPHTVTLTTDEVKSTLKLRPGGEKIAAQIAALAGRYKVEIPHISAEGMQADFALAGQLRPLCTALEQLTERVAQSILEAESEAWWAATGMYTALAGLSRSNPELQTAMRPISDFFATGRRRAKLAPATK